MKAHVTLATQFHVFRKPYNSPSSIDLRKCHPPHARSVTPPEHWSSVPRPVNKYANPASLRCLRRRCIIRWSRERGSSGGARRSLSGRVEGKVSATFANSQTDRA